jgi:heme A synthase
MKLTSFAKYTWGVLLFNLLVILWGAYVRASGSGAGCGSHWPLCNGVVIPRAPQVETIIEFTHRLSSGVAFLLIILLFIWAFKAFPRGSLVRLGASLSMVFIVTEALIGAGLVLYEWVAQNDSVSRAIVMSVHLINTYLLLAALALTAWWASGGDRLQFRRQGWIVWVIAVVCIAMLVLGVSGALTALGDTLFPVGSLAEGIAQDFSPTAHFLIRLRLFHPFIAMVVGGFTALLAGILTVTRLEKLDRAISMALMVTIAVQLGAGVLNVYLLAPIWLQIVHLLLADSVWVLLVLVSAATLSKGKFENRVKGSASQYAQASMIGE